MEMIFQMLRLLLLSFSSIIFIFITSICEKNCIIKIVFYWGSLHFMELLTSLLRASMFKLHVIIHQEQIVLTAHPASRFSPLQF